jgi:hypothetical protein
VGSALLHKKIKPKVLVSEWDRQCKGSISKLEFMNGTAGRALT